MDILILMSILLWCFVTNSCMSLPLQFLFICHIKQYSLPHLWVPFPPPTAPACGHTLRDHLELLSTSISRLLTRNQATTQRTIMYLHRYRNAVIEPPNKPNDTAMSASPSPPIHG